MLVPGAIVMELPDNIAGVETWGSGMATPMCLKARAKLGTRCATVTVTAPLPTVPSGVVTENEYVPGGTLAATLRVTGNVVLVTPVAIVATRPGCVNETAVALAKLVP
jgi:hypothetical protein